MRRAGIAVIFSVSLAGCAFQDVRNTITGPLTDAPLPEYEFTFPILPPEPGNVDGPFAGSRNNFFRRVKACLDAERMVVRDATGQPVWAGDLAEKFDKDYRELMLGAHLAAQYGKTLHAKYVPYTTAEVGGAMVKTWFELPVGLSFFPGSSEQQLAIEGGKAIERGYAMVKEKEEIEGAGVKEPPSLLSGLWQTFIVDPLITNRQAWLENTAERKGALVKDDEGVRAFDRTDGDQPCVVLRVRLPDGKVVEGGAAQAVMEAYYAEQRAARTRSTQSIATSPSVPPPPELPPEERAWFEMGMFSSAADARAAVRAFEMAHLTIGGDIRVQFGIAPLPGGAFQLTVSTTPTVAEKIRATGFFE